jgi:hypothetical protein
MFQFDHALFLSVYNAMRIESCRRFFRQHLYGGGVARADFSVYPQASGRDGRKLKAAADFSSR